MTQETSLVAGTAPLRPTRVGLVGVNQRARRLLLPGLAGSPRARLAAVCSRDEEKAAVAAAAAGPEVRAFTRVEEMAASGAVDAVFVNTPLATHARCSLAALRAGCAVICEKPLATSTQEAIALRDAAAAAGVRTAVNFTYRSVPGYRLTERLLTGPGIGRPLHAEMALLQGHNFLPGFPRSSALLDSGVHLLDTLVGLSALAGMGRIAEVSAAPMLHSAPAGGDVVDFGWGLLARTASGALLTANVSRSALGWGNGFHWGLYGEDGAIAVELDTARTEARLARRGEGRPQGIWRAVPLPPDITAADARFPEYHLDRLVGAVRGEEPFPDFAAAVTTHLLADALAAAAAEERWTPVPTIDS